MYLLKHVINRSTHNSWEPKENLECDDLIGQFEREIDSHFPDQFSKTGISRSANIEKGGDYYFGKTKKGRFVSGLKAERILGATTRKNKLVFLVKW